MSKNRCNVESYLQEGLLAVVPVYDDGYCSAVITLKGRHREARTVLTLIKGIAQNYSLDLSMLRRRSGQRLGIKYHVALPMTEKLVLLPVKVRSAAALGELTNGYVNMDQVAEILPPPEGEGPALSRLLFKNGFELATINTADKLSRRKTDGHTVLADFLERRGKGVSYSGMSCQDILDQLPNCNCVLKEIAIKVITPFDKKLY